jgi:hypothetical protein
VRSLQETDPVKTRTGRAAWLLALALLRSTSGCCTILTWQAAPTVEPARLTGASVDHLGLLTVGVEMSDGHVIAYREAGRSAAPSGPDDEWFIPTIAHDAADLPPFEHLASADGSRVEVPDWYRIPDRGSGPVAIVLERRDGGLLEIVTAKGVKRGDVEHPGTGDVDWIHPGTWLCVVATPVTVAVDVVTCPFQIAFFLFLAPRC